MLPAALSGVVCLVLLAGCGADQGVRADRDPDGRDRGRHQPGAGQAAPGHRPEGADDRAGLKPGERRAPAPQSAAPDPGPNRLTIEQVGGSGHLLGAGDLGPGWSVSATGPEDGRRLSRCQATSLYDIGAERTRLRDFATDDGARAGQAVSRFVDPKSAWRAERVVQAWRDDCARQLRRRDADLGAVRHGAWLSVVEISGVDDPRADLLAALRRVDATFS